MKEILRVSGWLILACGVWAAPYIITLTFWLLICYFALELPWKFSLYASSVMSLMSGWVVDYIADLVFANSEQVTRGIKKVPSGVQRKDEYGERGEDFVLSDRSDE